MSQSSEIVLINGFGVLFVIFNAFGLGLRLPVGKLLAQAVAHWKIAVGVLAINFVVIPLLFVGYLLTIASAIPPEIKVGFCVAALSAGMPFAPILARLAKADATIATTLLVVLTVGTMIALPLGLPLAIDAVDAQLNDLSPGISPGRCCSSCVLPLVLGCGFRIGWPDLTPEWAKWVDQGCDPVSAFQRSTSRSLRIGIYSCRPGAPKAMSRHSPAHSSASPVATFSFPVFESRTWESGMRPSRRQRCATSLRCS